jgi:F420-non-reducing hydrogenase large subunit
MTRQILIDPVTRLEGHGRIDIRLDDAGNVAHAVFQVPDFKGFEKFCEGRAAEEMPILTQKICGVCPTAHHIASAKALDDLFGVSPPPAALAIRELMHTAFVFEDHLLHFFYLGGPDILVGGDLHDGKHNIFGALQAVGAAL